MIEDFGPFWRFIVGSPESANYFETVDLRGAQKAIDAGLIRQIGEDDGLMGHRHKFDLTRQGHRQRIFDQVLSEKIHAVRAEYERRLNPPVLRAAS